MNDEEKSMFTGVATLFRQIIGTKYLHNRPSDGSFRASVFAEYSWGAMSLDDPLPEELRQEHRFLDAIRVKDWDGLDAKVAELAGGLGVSVLREDSYIDSIPSCIDITQLANWRGER